MTPRRGESRKEFAARRAAFDQDRPDYERGRTAKADVARLAKEVRKLKAEISRRDADAREAKLAATMRFDPLVILPESHSAGSPGMPMTMWSDWHCGETVDLRETGGLNEFNREIFQARVARLARNTISLLRDYAGVAPDYPGMWVNLGGDMVSGLIHDELVETNWGNIVEQAMECCGAIVGALLTLADFIKGTIYVPCVVGNHGRTTHKPRMKGRSTDSYDRAIYQSVAGKLASDTRFKFIIPDDTDYLYEVYGHRFLLTHGDSLGVKGGDGIIGALGPITRGTVKLRNSEGQVGRDFDTVVMGHWHQYIPRGDALPAIVNGTLKGYDEFARIGLRARFSRPSQALWLVSPKYGIAAQWAVYL